MLFERFAASSRRQRWPVLLPTVTDQTQPRIPHGPFGGRRRQHSLPALILIDIEWALIQTVSNLRCEVEVTIPLDASGDVGARQRGQEDCPLQEISATHFRV